jgi:DNA-binding NarL/FixJ family response regulator
MRETVNGPPIKVFLLIENRLLREALSRLFKKHSEFQISGQCGRGELQPRDLLERDLDVLTVDFFDSTWLPAQFGRGTSTLCKIRTLLIGMGDDSEQFLEAVRAGVSGYLLKDASASDVVAAIRAICRGEAICPPQLSAALFRWFAQAASQKQHRTLPDGRGITLRQRQLVNLVAQGLTNKEIASHLNLSEFTVRNHIHRILKQVDVSSRREAVDVILARKYAPLH